MVQANRAQSAGSVSAAGTASLNVVLNIKPDGITIKQEGDRYTGRLDVLMIPFDARGDQLDGPADTITLNMHSETYKKFTVAGVPLNKTLPLSPLASSLRIVVRDAGSGMIGSITVPLKDL